jgi:hypothetical protein
MRVLIILLPLLSACTTAEIVYQTASISSGVTTGKTLAEHALSQVTQADCKTANIINGKYYCERAKEPGTTYNRNGI